jgi:hypothetical protein
MPPSNINDLQRNSRAVVGLDRDFDAQITTEKFALYKSHQRPQN